MLVTAACVTTWDSRVRVDPRWVARALNDTAELPGEGFNPQSVPEFGPPIGIRPCCLFGMDLEVKVGALPVPGYKIGNIKGRQELGPHGYDKGNLKAENNGLVYTCRGGFIDVAHIRDNADRTLYLAMQFARWLPAGFTVHLPEEGAVRAVVVKPLPAGLLSRHGRWQVAVTLAQWVNFQLSIWHEIATWYGWESIKGFSERSSAFSPEDLYSNVVGQKLAAGIVEHREGESRTDYDHAMDAWIQEALLRLGAVPQAEGRSAMRAVDGIIWDSHQRVPDNKLVIRRNLNIGSPQRGWLVADVVPAGPVRDELARMCRLQPPPLPLQVPAQLGDTKIEDLATVEFTFSGWIPERFPLPARKGDRLTQAQFPAIMSDIRAQGQKELGPDFDSASAHSGSELASWLSSSMSKGLASHRERPSSAAR
jgi:hypothetical protein